MVVQQHVLNWLYSVLTSVSLSAATTITTVHPMVDCKLTPLPHHQEYHDVNRTYNDVAGALSQYTTLSPKTDVYSAHPAQHPFCIPADGVVEAFPNGNSALLLHLSGTIPVLFRGATYRFPISLWVPHAYPREPPLVYVTPTETMVVRPGQHVDPQGQVYHPYLVGWPTFWDVRKVLIKEMLRS